MKLKILEIGEDAYFEDYPMLVIFNENAPFGIKEISLIHNYKKYSHEFNVVKGDEISFGDQTFKVEKVGSHANRTLNEFGHTTFYFENINELPIGAILLEEKDVPKVSVEDRIIFHNE